MKKENEILEALNRGDRINKVIRDLGVCYRTVKKVIDKNPDLAERKKGRPQSVNNTGRYSFRTSKAMADKVDAHIKAEKSTKTKFFNNLLEEWGCGE